MTTATTAVATAGANEAVAARFLNADAAQGTRLSGSAIPPADTGSARAVAAPATRALPAASIATVQASPRRTDNATSMTFTTTINATTAASIAAGEKSTNHATTANRTPRLSLTNSGNLQRISFVPAISNTSRTAHTTIPATMPPRCARQSTFGAMNATATLSPMLITKKLAGRSIRLSNFKHSNAPRMPEVPADAPTVA